MNIRNKKYLRDAQANANQAVMSANGSRYFGADGFIDKAMGFTNDLNPGEFYPADGAGSSAAAAANPQGLSQPYIFTVSNASATQQSNFPLWGANIYLDQSRFTWSQGVLTISGVSVTLISSPAGSLQSYYTALQQALTNNFTVGKTYLASISGSSTQVLQPLGVNTYDTNGNLAGKILPSPLSPNQYQAGVYENNFAYRIDGNTIVTINVLPSAVFQIYFYPSFTINLSRGLGDAPIGRSFAAPAIGTPLRMITS